MQMDQMQMDQMQMHIGQTVEIIYQDKAGNFTQRKIEVNGIREDRIRWPIAIIVLALAANNPDLSFFSGSHCVVRACRSLGCSSCACGWTVGRPRQD